VREPLLLSRERACEQKIKWENRKYERSCSRLTFLKKRNPRIGHASSCHQGGTTRPVRR
jgi:hypothetical protein